MRFVADRTVGKLRRWMSLMGYDVAYDARPARAILRDPAFAGFVVLGRCPSLLEEKAGREAREDGTRFFHIPSPVLSEQIRMVSREFPLDFSLTAFSRCQPCNTPLEGPLPLDAVVDKVPELVREWRADFFRCPRCGRVYWEGTHTARVREVLKNAGVETGGSA